MPRRCLETLICCALFVAVGCGGGGSGGSQTGQVAVLVADGPADYDHIFLTIHEVSLLGEGHPITVYESADGKEVDILDLRDEDFLLAVEEVPSGTYHKVRLRVSRLRAIGGPCEDLTMKLPSGKLDLNPRGPFRVIGGETLEIRLDIDANKSIHLHQAGNSGKCIFRPVAFVDIRHGTDGCPRTLEGRIAERFETDGLVDGLLLDFGSDRGHAEIIIDDETIVFNAAGEPIAPEDLPLDVRATVRGPLTSDGRILASIIVVGETERARGIAQSEVTDGEFLLRVEDGDFEDGDLTVRLSDNTIILQGCDERVGPEAIQPGAEVRVRGKHLDAEGVLLAHCILVRNRIVGELISVAPTEGGHELAVRPEGAEETVSYLLPSGESVEISGRGPITFVELDELLDCGPIDVAIEPDATDPGIARKVIISPDRLEGPLEAVDPVERRLMLNGILVDVLDTAVVLDLRGGENDVIPLGSLGMGDLIQVYGFPACDGGDVEFVAFLVLVHD